MPLSSREELAPGRLRAGGVSSEVTPYRRRRVYGWEKHPLLVYCARAVSKPPECSRGIAVVVAERCRETRREGRVAGEAVREFLGTTPPSGGISQAAVLRKAMYSGLYGVCDSRSGVGGTEQTIKKLAYGEKERERDTHIIILMRVRGNSREPDELSESTWGIQKGEN